MILVFLVRQYGLGFILQNIFWDRIYGFVYVMERRVGIWRK